MKEPAPGGRRTLVPESGVGVRSPRGASRGDPDGRPDPVLPVAPTLFFDGDCALCSAGVAWCLERDRRGTLRFAPLSGSTFAGLEPPDWARTGDTLVLHDGRRFLVRGDAVIATLAALGGPWTWAARAMRLVPPPLRDALYRAVARRRHRLGMAGARCRTLGPEERARMLP